MSDTATPPPSLQDIIRQAFKALEAGDLTAAQQLIAAAMAEGKDEPEVHNLSAILAHKAGRPNDAIAAMRRVIRLAPQDPRYLTNLGELLRSTGQVEAAEAVLREAVRVAPDNALAQDALGLALANAGRTHEAAQHFLRALEIDKGLLRAYCNLGNMLLNMKQHEKAAETFESALKISADFTLARLGLASALEALGRSEDAKQQRALVAEEEVRKLREGDASAQDLGEAASRLFAAARFGEARDAFAAAVDKAPNNREYLFGLSASLAGLGEVEQAKKVTAHTIERFPSFSRNAAAPEARVLVLEALYKGFISEADTATAIYANSNIISQIPAERITFHHLLINHPNPIREARALGRIDLVYNNVANAELCEQLDLRNRVSQLVEALALPALNDPTELMKTTRRQNYERLRGLPGVLFPKTIAIENLAGREVVTADYICAQLKFPILLRRRSTHSDTSMMKLDTYEQLVNALRRSERAQLYAIEYHDAHYREGFHIRMRAAAIGGRLYPGRLCLETDWQVRGNVSYASMLSNPDAVATDKAFVDDMEGFLGPKRMEVLQRVVESTKLDYFGIDFAFHGEEGILLFEVTPASICLHPHRVAEGFLHLAPADRRLRQAFETLLLERARGSGQAASAS